MNHATPKEKVLKKIRDALIHKTPQPFPDTGGDEIYVRHPGGLDILFAEEFNRVSGSFVFNSTTDEFIRNITSLAEEKEWNHLYCWDRNLQQLFSEKDFRKCRIGKNIDKADAGVTLCEALIARTGSVLLSSALESGRTLPVFPPVHIVVAYTDQLVYDLKDGLELIRKKYGSDVPSMISLATGPSRTADIEKTLVLGAHGPGEVYVFLIDRRN